jgi:hypothetical protein
MRSIYLRENLSFAWKRLNVIAAIVGDVQGRLIATLFYFTIFLPFGIGSRLFSDPLRLQRNANQDSWLSRQPIPTELDAAKKQG